MRLERETRITIASVLIAAIVVWIISATIIITQKGHTEAAGGHYILGGPLLMTFILSGSG